MVVFLPEPILIIQAAFYLVKHSRLHVLISSWAICARYCISFVTQHSTTTSTPLRSIREREQIAKQMLIVQFSAGLLNQSLESLRPRHRRQIHVA